MKHILLFVCALTTVQAQWKQIGPRAYTGVIAIDPTNANTIYIDAAYDDTVANRQIMGIRKTTDGGQTWTFYGQNEGLYFYSGGIRAIIVDPQNPNIVYVGGLSPWMAVAKSTDGGRTWVKSDSGIVSDHHGFTVQTMSFDSKRRILYAWDYSSFGGGYRSLDSAKTWQLVLPDRGAFDSVVDTITGTVYASTRLLSVSTDSGGTWSFYGDGISGSMDLRWLDKRQGSDTMYSINYDVDADSMLFYVSINGGKSWLKPEDNSLQRSWLGGPIAVSPRNASVVYVGARPSRRYAVPGGLYRTTNAGLTWNFYTENLPLPNDSLFVTGLQTSGERVYVNLDFESPLGEHRGALFMREDVPTDVEKTDPQVVLTFSLLDPYPNPFNSMVTIQFTLEQQREIKLSIFDLLGREVNVLASGLHTSGSHRAQWQGTSTGGAAVPTGMYFVRLQSSKSYRIKRVLLIR